MQTAKVIGRREALRCQSGEAQLQMVWFIRIVIVIVVAALVGEAPLAIHPSGGYNTYQQCMTILGFFWIRL